MLSNKPLTLLLTLSICLGAAPLQAQQPQPAGKSRESTRETTKARKETALTVDNLLAADSYKVYGEVRNVGQVIRSANVADIIEPVMKLAAPPKEFKSMVRFANAHADSLESCRLIFAAWAVRPKLPQVLFAIEFSSPEEARKFEPQLREFLPTILPSPTPTPKVQTSEAGPQPSPAPPGDASPGGPNK